MSEHPSTSSDLLGPCGVAPAGARADKGRPGQGGGSGRGKRRLSRALRAIAVVAVLGALLIVVDRRASSVSESSAPPAAPPVDFLDAEKALASGEYFYLVLDPPGHSLRLMLKGAFLEEFPVDEVLVGTPRVFFFPSDRGSDWDLRVWAEGALDPPRQQQRIEVTPPDSALALDSLQPALPVPPPPEEAYHVPPVYRIRYAGGLTLVVESPPDSTAQGMPTGAEVFRSRAFERVQEFNASMAKENVRVRIKMRAEAAQRLYRALPADARFLVAPGFTTAESERSAEPAKRARPAKPAGGR